MICKKCGGNVYAIGITAFDKRICHCKNPEILRR